MIFNQSGLFSNRVCVYFKALGDIQIAVKGLQDEEESLEHPVDKHYKTLHCAMTPLDHDHDAFNEQHSLHLHVRVLNPA